MRVKSFLYWQKAERHGPLISEFEKIIGGESKGVY